MTSAGGLMADVRGASVRLGTMFVGAAVALLIGIVILGSAPTYEMENFPVLDNESVAMVREDAEGWAVFSLIVDKRRPCDFLQGSEIQWYATLDDGTSVRIPFETLRDATRAPNILPIGRFRLSTWRIKLPDGAVSHAGYLFFNCHLPWTTVTRLGPFPAWFKPQPGETLAP